MGREGKGVMARGAGGGLGLWGFGLWTWPAWRSKLARMGGLATYFRAHRRQRLALTLSAAVVLGLLGAMLAYPWFSDVLILRQMSSSDPARREVGMARAVAAMKQSPDSLRRFNAALDGADDRLFSALVLAMRMAGQFQVPGRTPEQIDRMWAIELESTRSESAPEVAARARWTLLLSVLRSQRDNAYVRRALGAGLADPSPSVRRLAARLAGRLGDGEALRRLLQDADSQVAGSAAAAAGVAGLSALRADLAGALASPDVELASSAAFGLARLEGVRAAGAIAQRFAAATEASLRDRLGEILGELDAPEARAALAQALTASGTSPSAALLLAGARLNLDEARQAVLRVLARALEGDADLLEAQLLAALQSAREMKMPLAGQALEILRRYWDPSASLTAIEAARLLGEQGASADAQLRGQLTQTLRQAAVFEYYSSTQPASQPIRMPVASAAAAVALWELDVQLADDYVRSVAAADTTLPGDYVAWALGRLGRPAAFDLGLAMLPPQRSSLRAVTGPARVYNDNERSAGAMLLALSAREEPQRLAARQRIEQRLKGPYGNEDNFFVIGAYQCALLMLGRDDLRPTVLRLLATPDFPQRRAMTALLAVGEPTALDWLLETPDRSEQGVVFLLIQKGIGEVTQAAVPDLPRVSAAVDGEHRAWQVRRMQDVWGVQGRRLRVGLP